MDQGLGLHLDTVRDQRESGLVDLTSHLQQLHLMPGAASGQLTGATPASPGMFPNMLQFPGQLATPLFMHPQAMTQQAKRHARLVYVSGLPPTANEQSVATFFSQVMAAIGGNSAGSGDAVINVYINHENKFSFVEMRSVQEASNAMALDGIIFEGAQVKVSRPSDYNHSLAAELGPSQPNPNLNLAAVGLTPGSGGGLEGPDRIFVGGLPYYFTEAKIRELLESFGPLRGFDLVKDRETGNSKAYAFCVYQDLSVTDIVCASLNGIKMGDKTLTVRRANQGAWQQKLEQESMLLQSLLKLEQESRLLHAQRQVALQDAPVNVRRPSDFNPSLAEALGPSQPYPNLNLAAVGLTPGSAGGLEAPDLIYVGGLPFYVTEAQIRELLEFFGPLRGFDLVKDRETGNSKGYAFCVYQDLSVTDIVCAGLNGIKMGDKTLIVRRASQGAWQLKYEQESAQQQRLLQGGALPTKVISLTQVVSADELMDDDEYEDILEDMSTEGRKYGNLVNVVIPRPGPNGELSPGVGKVFLEYTDTDGATIARQGLHGRVFGGNLVTANFYAEDKFSQGDYNG